MTALAVRVGLLLGVLFGIGACTPPPPRPVAPASEEVAYVVQAGDTLYSISFRRGLDYREVARWNGIGTDYRIYVGQRLHLSVPAGGVVVPAPRVEPKPIEEGPPSAPPHWLWPTDGPVLGSVTQPMGGVGLRMGGAPEAEIRAAAAGKVVYTGSGLRAYGLLVIVKHDETWLSAYGYNHDVLVHEGDTVREGQPIARMGDGPGGAPTLYFEIRSQGKPIDPLKLLPRR
jgi:lipoprotein NlpD